MLRKMFAVALLVVACGADAPRSTRWLKQLRELATMQAAELEQLRIDNSQLVTQLKAASLT